MAKILLRPTCPIGQFSRFADSVEKVFSAFVMAWSRIVVVL